MRVTGASRVTPSITKETQRGWDVVWHADTASIWEARAPLPHRADVGTVAHTHTPHSTAMGFHHQIKKKMSELII